MDELVGYGLAALVLAGGCIVGGLLLGAVLYVGVSI